jgi:hypothetical protein
MTYLLGFGWRDVHDRHIILVLLIIQIVVYIKLWQKGDKIDGVEAKTEAPKGWRDRVEV